MTLRMYRRMHISDYILKELYDHFIHLKHCCFHCLHIYRGSWPYSQTKLLLHNEIVIAGPPLPLHQRDEPHVRRVRPLRLHQRGRLQQLRRHLGRHQRRWPPAQLWDKGDARPDWGPLRNCDSRGNVRNCVKRLRILQFSSIRAYSKLKLVNRVLCIWKYWCFGKIRVWNIRKLGYFNVEKQVKKIQ